MSAVRTALFVTLGAKGFLGAWLRGASPSRNQSFEQNATAELSQSSESLPGGTVFWLTRFEWNGDFADEIPSKIIAGIQATHECTDGNFCGGATPSAMHESLTKLGVNDVDLYYYPAAPKSKSDPAGPDPITGVTELKTRIAAFQELIPAATVKGVVCAHEEHYACPGELTEWAAELGLETMGVGAPGILQETKFTMQAAEFYEPDYVPSCTPPWTTNDGASYATEMLEWQQTHKATWPLKTPNHEFPMVAVTGGNCNLAPSALGAALKVLHEAGDLTVGVYNF